MIIATFNANSVRARLDAIIAWLNEHRPDVLCLQETKVVDADFPALAFTEAGYHVVFHGEKSYNGVAIASLAKPDTVSFGLDDGASPDPFRLAHARFGALHVVNTYVPQGREITHAMYRYKLDWLQRLRDYFDRHLTPRKQVAWAGDLNVARGMLDIHNAEKQADHVCFHADVRRAFETTLEWGFTDVCREQHPDERIYTFFDYRTVNAVKRNMGWRIDYILATPPLARRVRSCTVDLQPRLAPKPSDHTFLVAEFAD
jgi:exodeoxyribonuclease III